MHPIDECAFFELNFGFPRNFGCRLNLRKIRILASDPVGDLEN